MFGLITTLVIVFLQIMICKKAKRIYGLVLPVLSLISSVAVIVPAIMEGVSEPAYHTLLNFLLIFNDYTIDFILLMIVYIIYGRNKAASTEVASAPNTENNEMIAEWKDGMETTKQIFKDKEFQKEVKDGIFSAVGLTTALMIGITFIIATVGFFLLMNSLDVSNKANIAKDAEMTYNDYVYREFHPYDDTLWDTGEYVNLANLQIEPLTYTCETKTGYDEPAQEYYLSTIDNIKAPTEEYTLSYHVYTNVDISSVDEAEQELLDDFDGTPVAAQLNYGADTAYWLDDELLLRYDEQHLLYFYDDTTRALIDNEETAAFIRDRMQLGEPYEKVSTWDYVSGKKGAKQD